MTAEPFLKPVKRGAGADPAAADAGPSKRPGLSEDASPTAGRRFTRA